MRRLAVALLAFTAAACGGTSPFSSVPATAAATTATATTAGTPSTALPPDTTLPPAADLTVLQVLVRLDGALPVGTFDATICNRGSVAAGPFRVTIAANGVEAVAEAPGLEPRSCRDASDPAVTFADFGVAVGDRVAVTVSVSSEADADPADNRLETLVAVDRTTPEVPDPQKEENYQWCLRDWPHDQCLHYLGLSPAADPREITKLGAGWAAVVPAEYEPIAAQAVATMAICFPALEAYLGIPFHEPFLPFPWRFAVGPSHFGAHWSGITLIGDAEYFDGVIAGGYSNWQWAQVLDGKCQEAHEPTHVMVAGTPIPGWLNEGLAVHMSNAGRSNWYCTEPTFRCAEDGYYDINTFQGTETYKPYADLEGGYEVEGRERGDYYATGACFWEWFEGAYGHDAFQQVMQALAELRLIDGYPDAESCPNFLGLVEPIIGEDISPYTEAHFGFGRDYDIWSP